MSWLGWLFGLPDRPHASKNTTIHDNLSLVSTFETTIAGTTHEGRQRWIKLLSAGDTVSLRREPNNPYDSNAVGVYDGRGRSLGYIPATIAMHLSDELAESGKIITAHVLDLTESDDEYTFRNALLEIRIYR